MFTGVSPLPSNYQPGAVDPEGEEQSEKPLFYLRVQLYKNRMLNEVGREPTPSG